MLQNHQRSFLFELFSTERCTGATRAVDPARRRPAPESALHRWSPEYQSSLQQVRCAATGVWAVQNGLENTTTAFDSKHKRIPGSRVLDTRAQIPRRIARRPYRSTTSICLLPRLRFEEYCGRLRGRLQWVRRVISGHLFGLQGRRRQPAPI